MFLSIVYFLYILNINVLSMLYYVMSHSSWLDLFCTKHAEKIRSNLLKYVYKCVSVYMILVRADLYEGVRWVKKKVQFKMAVVML